MSDALDTMSLHSFDRKMWSAAESGGQTAGVVRDEQQAAIEAFNEKDEKIRLDIRRGLEIRLVKKHDKGKINPRHECWFLMDCRWLNEWAYFVEGNEGSEPPGRITTAELLDENKKPLKDLEPKIDYRGVPPTVYFCFKELYGVDKEYPVLCRYKVDIYAPPVPDDQLVKIVSQPQRIARVQVAKLKSRWEKQQEMDDDDDDECCKCCGLTKDHYEAFLFWFFTCCLRKRSGRKDISYRQYQPLKRTTGGLDDSSHHSDLDMSTTSTLTLGSGLGSGSDVGDYDLDVSRRSNVSITTDNGIERQRLLASDGSWSGQARYWMGHLFSWSI